MEYFITITEFGNVGGYMLLTRNDGVFYSIDSKQISFDTEILQTAFEKGWIMEVSKEDFKRLSQISNCLYHASLAGYVDNAHVYNKTREVVDMLSVLYQDACYKLVRRGRSDSQCN